MPKSDIYYLHPRDQSVPDPTKVGHIYYGVSVQETYVSTQQYTVTLGYRSKKPFPRKGNFTCLKYSPNGLRFYQRGVQGSFYDSSLAYVPSTYSFPSYVYTDADTTHLIKEEFIALYNKYHEDKVDSSQITNRNYLTLMFPPLRHGWTDQKNSSKILQKNARYKKALRAETRDEFIKEAYRTDWYSNQDDIAFLSKRVDLLSLGNLAVGYNIKDIQRLFPDFNLLLQLPLFSYKILEVVLQYTPNKQRKYDIIKKVLDIKKQDMLTVELFSNTTKGKYRGEPNLQGISSTKRRILAEEFYTKILSQTSNLTAFIEEVTQSWFKNHVIFNSGNKDTSTIKKELSQLMFDNLDYDILSSEPGSLVEIDSPEYALFSNRFAEAEAKGSVETSIHTILNFEVASKPKHFVNWVFSDDMEKLESWEKSDVYALVSFKDAYNAFKSRFKECDDVLIANGMALTSENRKLYLSLPQRHRKKKNTWTLVRYGVTSPSRIVAFKKAKITRKKDITYFNPLPDILFYDIISQDDEK